MQLLGALALGCVNTLQLLFYNFYNPRQQKLTPSRFVYLKNLQPMNSKVTYATLLFIGCKEK